MTPKETAQRVLLECGVQEFPADPWKICNRYGIATNLCDLGSNIPGISFVYDGIPMAFIRSSEPPNRQRFILAHEIGHLMLGHVGAWGNVENNRPSSRKKRERAAMTFAKELLKSRDPFTPTEQQIVKQFAGYIAKQKKAGVLCAIDF